MWRANTVRSCSPPTRSTATGELERERPFGIFVDLADMYRGSAMLRRHAASGAEVIPGHDPSVMDRFAALDGDAAGLAVCLTDSRSDR
jgi:glyoxylase-like metal-dependent hydrolase (beta-lactamase superfamily II)